MAHSLKTEKLFSSSELAEIQAFGEVRQQDGVTEFPGDNYKSTPIAHLITRLIKALKRNFRDTYGPDKLKVQQVWLQQTSASTPLEFPSSSPFTPHIDNQRYFKTMFLLHDTELEHGPFMTSGLNPNDFEELRGDLIQHNRKFPGEEMRFFADTLGHMKPEQFSPVTGKAGDAIFFDTNTPHYAGTPSGENIRKIIRVDALPLRWTVTSVEKLRWIRGYGR